MTCRTDYPRDIETEVDAYESNIWPRRYLLIAEAKEGDLVAELRASV